MFKEINCIIVDDEPAALFGLSNYISKIPYLNLVDTCENSIDASNSLKTKKVDLMFLDINMPGVNGIDFLKSLEFKPKTIITSAYSEYAIDGFELDVIDFLVKPFSFNRFEKAIEKAINFIELSIISKSKTDDYIFIKSNKKIEKIFHNEINYIEAMHNYVVIYTKNERHITYTSLKEIEKQLPTDFFVKIQRSFIVSKIKVKSIKNGFVFIDDKKISISRKEKAKVIEQLLKK